MIRHFVSGSGSKIHCAPGTVPSNGTCTIAAIVQFDPEAVLNGSIQIFKSFGGGYGMGIATGASLFMSGEGLTSKGSSITTFEKGKKYLIAVSMASTSTPVTFHKYDFETKTWAHNVGATALGNATGTVTGINVPEGLEGFMTAAAIWPRGLSNAEVEALVAFKTIEEWKTTTPSGFWTFGQRTNAQLVKDWTGNGANQNEATGGSATVEENVAPLIPYTEREEITWLPTLDTLEHTVLEAQFTKIPWSPGSGTWVTGTGWKPAAFVSEPANAQDHSGVFLNTVAQSLGHNAAAVELKTSSGAVERTLNIWLYLNSAKTKPTGYQLSTVGVSGTVYKIKLTEWNEGTEVKSSTSGEKTIESTGGIAITHKNGIVRAFVRKLVGSEWEQVLEFATTGFTEGFIGIGGNGSNPLLNNLAGGVLEGTNEGGKEKKVKVLKGGSIVEAKRWVLSGGKLVNA